MTQPLLPAPAGGAPLWPPRRLTLAVPPAPSDRTVDALLRRTLHLSGTLIKRAKAVPDGILLDGVPVSVTRRAGPGQVLSVLVGDTAAEGGVPPAPGPLRIVFEDPDLLILDKAAGVAVHPGPGHPSDTLGNFVADYYRRTGQIVRFRPVHRLDRGTSGLICIAKHAHAQEVLKTQLHTPSFRRVYLAVCEGWPEPPAGVIDAPIGRAEDSAIRREIRPGGSPARTHYQVLAVSEGRSLVRLELETGRTHQIRVHLASLGHPLTGDFLYGTEDPSLIARPALHAAELSLTHPVTGVPLSRRSPLPPDILALLGQSESPPHT